MLVFLVLSTLSLSSLLGLVKQQPALDLQALVQMKTLGWELTGSKFMETCKHC